MSKNLLDLRFGIRAPNGFVSSAWRTWVTRHGDVYLATRFMARIEKYSFHRSGLCRSAFTNEHGTPKTMNDRAMFKWRRNVTPPAGSGRVARIAWIAFPTDYLSRPKAKERGEITWIDAAPPGNATYIELGFTAESETTVRESFSATGLRGVICYLPLPNEEALLIDYYHSDWKNDDLQVPGDGKAVDLLFSAHDQFDTGRPIRIRFGPMPKDGDAVLIQELGGFVDHFNHDYS